MNVPPSSTITEVRGLTYASSDQLCIIVNTSVAFFFT